MRHIVKHRGSGLLGWFAGLAMGVALVLVSPAPSWAQGWGGGNPFEATVQTRDITELETVLGLDDEQKSQVKELYAGYSLEQMQAAERMRDMMNQVQQDFQESRDPTVWQEAMPKFIEFGEHAEKLEQSLFDDIKLLLTEEQLEKWVKFERRHRRAQSLRQAGGSGMISGDAVELVEIVQAQKLPPDQMASIDAVLDQYEADMDRVVQARIKATKEMTKRQTELMGDFFGNMDKFEAMWAELRDMSVQIRDLNYRYARQVSGMLNEDQRPAFDRAFNEKAAPEIYKESFVDSAFKLARGMEDLTAEQRTGVAEAQASYEREAAAINERWSAARREWEPTMKMTDLWQAGNRPAAINDARKAREELDERTFERLRNMLSEEQRARLPERRKADWRRSGGFGN